MTINDPDAADREAFEAWYRPILDAANFEAIGHFRCDQNSQYRFGHVRSAYDAWRAALAHERAKTPARITELEAELALFREDCAAYRAQHQTAIAKWHALKTALGEAEKALDSAALVAIRNAKESAPVAETQKVAADPKAGGADDVDG